jgi:hypothetical protein
VNGFAKKNFREISENQPTYQTTSTRLKQGHHCPKRRSLTALTKTVQNKTAIVITAVRRLPYKPY